MVGTEEAVSHGGDDGGDGGEVSIHERSGEPRLSERHSARLLSCMLISFNRTLL